MFSFYARPDTMATTLHALHAALGPVFRLPFGIRTVLLTADPADCARIVGRPAEWPRSPAQLAMMEVAAPGGLFVMPRPAHATVRRSLREVFGPALLPAFWPAVGRELNTLVEDLERARLGGATGEEGGGGAAGSGDGGSGPGAVVDVSAAFSDTSYRLIFRVAFGAPFDAAQMRRAKDASGALVYQMMVDFIGYPIRQSPLLAPLGLRAGIQAASAELRTLYRDILVARRAEAPSAAAARTPDLLDILLALPEAGAPADSVADMETAISNAMVFGAAGGTTSAEVAAWSVYHIACCPDATAAVAAEVAALDADTPPGGPARPLALDDLGRLPYLRAVWKESLRLTPPGLLFERVAARDTVLPGSGVRVRAGTIVAAFAAGAARDPAVWERPLDFLPPRWLPGGSAVAAGGAAGGTSRAGGGGGGVGGGVPPAGAYIPFSVGPENCAGTFLADAEGVAMLATLYRAYEVTLAVPPDAVRSVSGWTHRAGSAAPGGKPGNADRGVPVRLTPRRRGVVGAC